VSEFSETLSQALSASSLSLRKLSERVGVNVATLSQVSSGVASPSPKVLKKLCEWFTPEKMGELPRNYAPELLTAHLRDAARASGLDTSRLVISFSSAKSRFDEFPDELSDTLYTLGRAAKVDWEFNWYLSSSKKLALEALANPKSEETFIKELGQRADEFARKQRELEASPEYPQILAIRDSEFEESISTDEHTPEERDRRRAIYYSSRKPFTEQYEAEQAALRTSRA